MKNVLILFLSLNVLGASAQRFTKDHELNLPDSVVHATFDIADLDNDGLQDIYILTKTTNRHFVFFVKGDTSSHPVVSETYLEINRYSAYTLTDYDLDNFLDILISEEQDGLPKTTLYRNKGNFEFELISLDFPHFQLARFADLNNDGSPEAVFSGTDQEGKPFTRTYERSNSLHWRVVDDSLRVALTSFEILDMDGNGNPDAFISGKNQSNGFVTKLFIEEEGHLKQTKSFEKHLSAVVCDIDTDGFLDIIAYGEQAPDEYNYLAFVNSNAYDAQPLAVDGLVWSCFWADLDGDGFPDENIVRTNQSGDTLNQVRYANGISEYLDHEGLQVQRFADLEHDGDLDLVQLKKKTRWSIQYIINSSVAKNTGPARPIAFAFPVYNRILLYWDKTSDDHTPVKSVTYDVYLEGNSVNRESNFDLINSRRLRSAHGNNGTNNFLLLRNSNINGFNYAIQSIDNALHASSEICFGSGVNCGEVQHEKIVACTGEKISFTAPGEALWFSLSKGFFGAASEYEYKAEGVDTVFYVLPTGSCPVLNTFEIEVNDQIVKEEREDIFACRNSDVTLRVNTDWSNIEWWSDKEGLISTSASIIYTAESDDIVSVHYSNADGCRMAREHTITISEPRITGNTSYKIGKGQSVQLSVSGGERYEWSPAQGLNRTDIPNPIASPIEDTRYKVTVYDSIDCAATVEVMVVVESTGFIPTLFTPNGDGHNDQLKAYGISGVESFSFRIYNREGSIVYKTRNPADVTGQGWDGSTNGVPQPNGVYYWKVEGTLSTGSKLLLNGKEEGSLVLLR